MSELPTLKWGIIGTGLISSWFVRDLLLDRESAKANHQIVAIGARSIDSASKFKKDQKVPSNCFIGTYDQVYENKDVDVIYIGLPHVFHKENAIKAMENGKHVLVEKPGTINSKDFKELIEAAKKNNVFLMEGVWLRFRPLILEIQSRLFKDKELGELYRLIVDFSMDMEINSKPDDSRLKSNELGAGSLLDIGIYSLTYSRLLLDENLGRNHTPFSIKAFQTVHHDIDYVSSAMIQYKSTQRQAIICSSVYNKTQEDFLRLDGELGTLIISGPAASAPTKYRIEYKDSSKATFEKEFPFSPDGPLGFGFYYEADAIALDITNGKKQNALMPWDESVLVLETLDEIRKQGGVVYPQDLSRL